MPLFLFLFFKIKIKLGHEVGCTSKLFSNRSLTSSASTTSDMQHHEKSRSPRRGGSPVQASPMSEMTSCALWFSKRFSFDRKAPSSDVAGASIKRHITRKSSQTANRPSIRPNQTKRPNKRKTIVIGTSTMLSIDALIQSETMPSNSNDHKNELCMWQGKRGDSLVSRPLVLSPKAMTLSKKDMSIRKRSSKNVQVKNWQVVSRRRGAQRYHALLQRIGGECHGMREHLGEIEWADFCQHAKRHYQPRFISRFEPLGPAPTLTCVGPITLGMAHVNFVHTTTQSSFSFSVQKTLKPRKRQAKHSQIFTSTTQ